MAEQYTSFRLPTLQKDLSGFKNLTGLAIKTLYSTGYAVFLHRIQATRKIGFICP